LGLFAARRYEIDSTKTPSDVKNRAAPQQQIEAKKADSPLETRFFPSSITRPVEKQVFAGDVFHSPTRKTQHGNCKKSPGR
jgi:hypothetical protein